MNLPELPEDEPVIILSRKNMNLPEFLDSLPEEFDPVITISRKYVEERAGRKLTDEEIARFKKAFEHSTIGDVVVGVLDSSGIFSEEEE